MTKTDRLDCYAEYLAKGEDRRCAALRLGISERTARRYDAELRHLREARPAA
jgi:hypothetical protein